MYLVVIAWIYVVLMMAVAEATNTTGTVLGAVVTFFLYGVGPAGLLVYLMGTPARNKALKKRQADERAQHMAGLQTAPLQTTGSGESPESPISSGDPDAGGHAAGGAEAVATRATLDASVPPVRKEL